MLAFVTTRAKLILPAAAFAVLTAWPATLDGAPVVLPVPTKIATASALAVQDRDGSNPDSVALHEQAKEAQARFERFREERIPPELAGYGGGCDEIIGRFCLRFEDGEDESEWSVPEEPVEFGMARVRVLRELAEVHAQIPRDSWILGQRVFYMGEVGDWRGAENLIRRCGGGNWWCTSLLGFVRHAQGDWNTAADLFALAKSQIPEGENFLSLALLLDPDALEVYEGSSDRAAAEERLWLLSDPLYLVDGNDRMTEQYARAVIVRMRREAVNPYGVEWGDDIEELTLRYGAEKGVGAPPGLAERDAPGHPQHCGPTPSEEPGVPSARRGPRRSGRGGGRRLDPGATTPVDRVRTALRAGPQRPGDPGGSFPARGFAARGGGLRT